MKNAICALLAILTLNSCNTGPVLTAPSPGTGAIRLATEQKVAHRHGTIHLPAGLYRPEAASSQGVYYAAPEPIYTGGIVRGGKEHGGVFVRQDGAVAVWAGSPGYQLSQASKTVLGARGVEKPTLYGLKQSVLFSKE